MALDKADLQEINEYVKNNIGNWLLENNYIDNKTTEIALIERMVRVEEELKNQRELIKLGFEQSDKRFAEMQANANIRFAEMQVNSDKRFADMDKRFEQVDKRFDFMSRVITWMFSFMILGFAITNLFIGFLKFAK